MIAPKVGILRLEYPHIWDFVLPEWWHHSISPLVANWPLIMTILAICCHCFTISASRQQTIAPKVGLLGLEYPHIWDFVLTVGWHHVISPLVTNGPLIMTSLASFGHYLWFIPANSSKYFATNKSFDPALLTLHWDKLIFIWNCVFDGSSTSRCPFLQSLVSGHAQYGMVPGHAVQHCTVLHTMVWYQAMQHSSALYCTLWYGTRSCSTVSHCAAHYGMVPGHAVQYRTVLHTMVWYQAIQYSTALYCTLWSGTRPCNTVPHCTAHYGMVPGHAAQYHTVLHTMVWYQAMQHSTTL